MIGGDVAHCTLYAVQRALIASYTLKSCASGSDDVVWNVELKTIADVVACTEQSLDGESVC